MGRRGGCLGQIIFDQFEQLANFKGFGKDSVSVFENFGIQFLFNPFDSEEAARGFWQEAEEFDFSEYIAVQYGARPVYFVPIHPSMLAEFVRTVGHPFVAVNPSILAAKEGPFVPVEEFLESA